MLRDKRNQQGVFDLQPMAIVCQLILSVLVLALLVACGANDSSSQPGATAAAEANSSQSAPPSTGRATATSLPMAVPSTATPEPTVIISTPAYEPVFEPATCAFVIPGARDVTCGFLVVPENRDDVANGRTVRLHVAVFASDSPNPAPDPIIYLEGGPGGEALEAAYLVFDSLYAPFLANHTFIMFDQRGTGYSEPSLACPELIDFSLEILGDDLTLEESQELELLAVAACRERLLAEGIDLSAYNSAENAADVADLRRALGYEEWNLYGISYGTRLAQTIVRDYPEGIRSVILDSAYPPAANIQLETVVNADRAFGVFFAGCAADPSCDAAYPELEKVFADLVAELNENPLILSVYYLGDRQNYDVLFDGNFMVSLLFRALYSVELTSIMPGLIFDVRDGRPRELLPLLTTLLAQQEYVSQGMQLSVQCHEEISFSTPDEVGQAPRYSYLDQLFEASGIAGQFGFRVCDLWQSGQAAAIENQAVSSDIPTLILAGEYDPITPPSWGRAVAEGFSNSFFYEFPGLGHGLSVSGDCPRGITLAFLADPEKEPDAACLTAMGSPAFALPAGISAETVALESYSNSSLNLSGVGPVGWEEVAPGTFMRGASGLDQTVLIQQVAPAGTSEEAFLGLLNQQLDLGGTLELQGVYEDANGRMWSLFASEFLGLPLNLGLLEDGAGLFVILLISESRDAEAFYNAIFLPAMDAIGPN